MFFSATHRQAMLIVPVFLAGFGFGQFRLADSPAKNFQTLQPTAAGYELDQESGRHCPDLSLQPAAACQLRAPAAGMSAGSQKLQRLKSATTSAGQRQQGRRCAGAKRLIDEVGRHSALWGAPVQNADGDLVIFLEAAGVTSPQQGQTSNDVMGVIIPADSPRD